MKVQKLTWVITLLLSPLIVVVEGIQVQNWSLEQLKTSIANRWTVAYFCTDENCLQHSKEATELQHIARRLEKARSQIVFTAIVPTEEICDYFRIRSKCKTGVYVFHPEYNPPVPQRPKQYHGVISEFKILHFLSKVTGIRELARDPSQYALPGCVMNIGQSDFNAFVMNPMTATIVLFCSQHLPPCKEHWSNLSEFARELCGSRHGLQIGFVDVSTNPVVTSKHKLTVLPSMVMYLNSEVNQRPIAYQGKFKKSSMLEFVDQGLRRLQRPKLEDTHTPSEVRYTLMLTKLSEDFCSKYPISAMEMSDLINELHRQAECNLISDGLSRFRCEKFVLLHRDMMKSIYTQGIEAVTTTRTKLQQKREKGDDDVSLLLHTLSNFDMCFNRRVHEGPAPRACDVTSEKGESCLDTSGIPTETADYYPQSVFAHQID